MAFYIISVKNECDTEEDCPNRGPCISPLGYTSNMELLLDDVNLSFGADLNKRCFFEFGNMIEPRLGGGNALTCCYQVLLNYF